MPSFRFESTGVLGRAGRRLVLPASVFLLGSVLTVSLLKCRSTTAAAPISGPPAGQASAIGSAQISSPGAGGALQAVVPPLLLSAKPAPGAWTAAAVPGAYAVHRDQIYAYRDPAPEPNGSQDGTAGGSTPLALLADVYIPQASSASDGAPPESAVNGRGQQRPAVVIIHGGSWQRGDRARMARIAGGLAAAGFVAVNIEYSLAPRYRFPAQLEDCRAAVLWIRKHARELNVDASRIGAFGYSAGAHLALMLATTGRDERDPARIQAVVAGAPPANLAAMPGPADRTLRRLLGADRDDAPQLYREASPVSHVSADDPPAFLYHGRYDWVVPVEQSREMADRLREAGVVVELFEGEGGHLSSAPFREETPVGLQAAIAFLKRYL